jgi:hypothetical protein
VQGVERPVVVDLIDAIEAELIDMREI